MLVSASPPSSLPPKEREREGARAKEREKRVSCVHMYYCTCTHIFMSIYLCNDHAVVHDMINFPQLLHSRPVLDTIPGFIANKRPPLVSYSYSKTIGPKIFNFKPCIKDFVFLT